MKESFADILAVGGKTNSLGRASEVIEVVLRDKRQLEKLYTCLFHDDSWVRMRAADSLEKICRVHPDWLLPYIDRFTDKLMTSTQPSIQWHLAQIYQQVSLTPTQKATIIDWLTQLLSTPHADWIVAANAMDTLVQFTADGSVPRNKCRKLLEIQSKHKSAAVVRRAEKLIGSLG